MGPSGVVPPMPRWLSGLLATVVLVAAVSGLLGLLEPHAPVLSLSVLYLLAVVPVAIVWGVRQSGGGVAAVHDGVRVPLRASAT
jgi:hypothetical protein